MTSDTPAPAGGIAVTLSSKQKKLVSLPGTVLLPESATTGTFTSATQTVRRSDTAEIRASFAGVTRTATLTVTPQAAVTPGAEWIVYSLCRYGDENTHSEVGQQPGAADSQAVR